VNIDLTIINAHRFRVMHVLLPILIRLRLTLSANKWTKHPLAPHRQSHANVVANLAILRLRASASTTSTAINSTAKTQRYTPSARNKLVSKPPPELKYKLYKKLSKHPALKI
jgi:hypothetical protein